MSEQTDPLAQLILDHRERHPLVGICRCGDFDVHDGYPSHLADAIRAAVLADPTIVGMEQAGWVLNDYCVPGGSPWVEHAESDDGGRGVVVHEADDIPTDAVWLYRTPEVKG